MRKEIFNDHTCRGRITYEHALMYAGRQINEVWAIISLCAYTHGVDEFLDNNILDKRKNEFIALSRATEEDLAKYPRKDWEQLKRSFSHLKN